jgi:farnesyl-diphosphate farnesyltransferase
MIKLGIDYGKGLQLINVLRDRDADRRAGRSYLPAQELATRPEAEVFAHWLDMAETRIGAGLDYCVALTSWRIRFATALPALIGARTIALLRGADSSGEEKVKVPRKEIRRILLAGLLAAASPLALRALFQRLIARNTSFQPVR